MALSIDGLLNFIRPPKVAPTVTQGGPGFIVTGGYLLPEERNRNLVGDKKWVTYQNILLNVSIAAASVNYYQNLITKASWKAEPVDDSAAAKEAAEFIDDVLDKLTTPWSRVVKKASMYKFFGFAAQEWTAIKRDDGQLGLKDIEIRPQRTIAQWDTDVSGTVLGMIQRIPQTHQDVYLPRKKLWYIVHDGLSDSPDGHGLLRQIAEPAGRLDKYLYLEGVGFENDLRGIPVARAPLKDLDNMVKTSQITAAEATLAKNKMVTFLEDHAKNPSLGLLLDSDTYRGMDANQTPSSVYKWDIALMRGEGQSTVQTDIHQAIVRVTQDIARIIGTEGLLLGADGKGSLALSKDKTNAFHLMVESSMTELAQTANVDLIDPLWKLNGFDEELKPKLKAESVQFRDVEQITVALKDMASAGVMLAPDDPAINEIREMLGLSEATMDQLMAGHLLGAAMQVQIDPETGEPVMPQAPGIPGKTAPPIKPGQKKPAKKEDEE